MVAGGMISGAMGACRAGGSTLADTRNVGLGCGDCSAGDGIEADGGEITGPAAGFTVVHLKLARGAVFSTTLEVSATGTLGIACLIVPAVVRGGTG